MDKLWTDGFLHGNSDRIFVNTSLGCRAQCAYCYLPEVGHSIGKAPDKKVTAKQILESLLNSEYYIEGKSGTIISVGCFSECWDEINKLETIEFIKGIVKKGNPIQISTKRFIDHHELMFVKDAIKWEGQLSIYISCASISNWATYEKGNVPPGRRFDSLEIQSVVGIPCYLYIKPVLQGITVQDKSLYSEVMRKYNIGAIVGSLFSTKQSKEYAPILPQKLYYGQKSDEEEIKEALRGSGEVYSYSIDPINEKRFPIIKNV